MLYKIYTQVKVEPNQVHFVCAPPAINKSMIGVVKETTTHPTNLELSNICLSSIQQYTVYSNRTIKCLSQGIVVPCSPAGKKNTYRYVHWSHILFTG